MDYLSTKIDTILPDSFRTEYTDAAKKRQESAKTMTLLFALALVFIYSILAIQFESFLDPLIIMLTVPLGCGGALLTLWILGESINIFTQIGLITLIGLITKHGILMVEFANQLREAGKRTLEAILEAAALRLRPILMTTISTICGAIPLIVASGAGAEARQAIGYVLVGGLLFGTLLTLVIIPMTYLLVKREQA